MKAPTTPVATSTHWNAFSILKTVVSKFIPNIPATTPKMATTNVAVVSSNSNWISWFRTLSWRHKKFKSNREMHKYDMHSPKKLGEYKIC